MPPSSLEASKRANLRKLNGDTTWLLQIHVGNDAKTYNLLIDPWLSTSQQVDYHPLFSAQTRVETASFPSLSALSQSLANETLEAAARERISKPEGNGAEVKGAGGIDAILISHPFSDHAHPETLCELIDQSRPIDIFCTPQSFQAVANLLNGKKMTVDQRKAFKLHLMDELRDRGDSLDSITSYKQDDVPSGLRLLRLPAQESPWTHGPAWADLHGGIAIIWDKSAVVYSPHGILGTSIPHALSQAHCRTLIQSFDRQTLPLLRLATGPVALGFHQAALSCFTGGQAYVPTLILRTHDEHKAARGLVGKIISRQGTSDEQAREALQREGCEHCEIRSLKAGQEVEVGGSI